jgi:hypothetical protein
MEVETKRIVYARRLSQRVERLGNKLGLPLGERRVVRDKIIPYFSSALRNVYSHELSNLASTTPDEQFGLYNPVVSGLKFFSLRNLCSLGFSGDFVVQTGKPQRPRDTEIAPVIRGYYAPGNS